VLDNPGNRPSGIAIDANGDLIVTDNRPASPF
jgi:hypothetical protein